MSAARSRQKESFMSEQFMPLREQSESASAERKELLLWLRPRRRSDRCLNPLDPERQSTESHRAVSDLLGFVPANVPG